MRTDTYYLSIDISNFCVGMKLLSERDENLWGWYPKSYYFDLVGMKLLSERDENLNLNGQKLPRVDRCRNEATL